MESSSVGDGRPEGLGVVVGLSGRQAVVKLAEESVEQMPPEDFTAAT
jgi:hypothetical protein